MPTRNEDIYKQALRAFKRWDPATKHDFVDAMLLGTYRWQDWFYDQPPKVAVDILYSLCVEWEKDHPPPYRRNPTKKRRLRKR